MKKPDLGQVIGILANPGVRSRIFLLAIALHQNNELMTAQARPGRIAARQTEYP